MNYLELYKEREWNVDYDELASMLILATCDLDEEIRNLEMVLKFYHEIRLRYKRIPALTEIYEEVYCYNWDIVVGFAMSIYLKNPAGDMQAVTDNLEIEIFEYINEDLRDLEIYIQDLLEEQKMAYTYDEDHPFYEINELKGVVAVANDCQNILFSEVFDRYDFFSYEQRDIIFLEDWLMEYLIPYGKIRLKDEPIENADTYLLNAYSKSFYYAGSRIPNIHDIFAIFMDDVDYFCPNSLTSEHLGYDFKKGDITMEMVEHMLDESKIEYTDENRIRKNSCEYILFEAVAERGFYYERY